MSAVPLGDDLGIEAATDLKQHLAPHLEQHTLVLDAGAVQRIHTASLQVLCSFVRQRQQAGLATDFGATSQSFRDAARLLGVGPQLGLTASDINKDNTQAVENAA
ncbi:STAS domain-containing protein [Pseudoxanthomonas sp. SL93]|jgi:ABC-type transporter Mla MlaB component|uniref:STAS domain-containing protein n=1 Tax=Pseudoxanthomonas sp. SL93 TaxID=2995142 RepID=UPI00226F18FF|nr:STAS domain-containing protein [Pseudoxanthomonas sp. SL93]WAC63832.1 STAS domain-containing protein [Pseudoxanthomonas sp. SL93]